MVPSSCVTFPLLLRCCRCPPDLMNPSPGQKNKQKRGNLDLFCTHSVWFSWCNKMTHFISFFLTFMSIPWDTVLWHKKSKSHSPQNYAVKNFVMNKNVNHRRSFCQKFWSENNLIIFNCRPIKSNYLQLHRLIDINI